MVWQLKRKRPTRRSYASSLAIIGAALLAQTDFTVLAATNSIRTPSEATDDTSSTQKNIDDKNNNRRLRADLLATRVENQSNKVTLLVKYKDNTGHRRSTETYNNRTLVDELQMDVWQAHTLSIETISINRYIDAVEIDTDVEDIELMKREIMEDGDVELVEEVCLCFCRLYFVVATIVGEVSYCNGRTVYGLGVIWTGLTFLFLIYTGLSHV